MQEGANPQAEQNSRCLPFCTDWNSIQGSLIYLVVVHEHTFGARIGWFGVSDPTGLTTH